MNKGDSSILHRLPVLYEARTLEALPEHLARFIASVIPVDTVAYNEVNTKQPRMIVVSHPSGLNDSPYVKHLVPLINQHPLVRYQRETGDLTARKISDFQSRAQYHNSAVYQEVYRHLGCEDQFAFSLQATPETIVAMAMNRSRRSFTEEHRHLLNLLQPHLIQAFRNAQVLSDLHERLAGFSRIMDNIPVAVLVIDRRQQIQYASARARRLLEKYFHHPASARELPPALRDWLTRSHHWHGTALPNPTGPFVMEGPDARLVVRCVREPGSDETSLHLEERVTRPSALPLHSLGMTAREAEVLLWVAQGKRNPEIAVILGMASRTVQKHLERIFVKLGVESRTAAANRALEILNGII